jgi:hypothetical protein
MQISSEEDSHWPAAKSTYLPIAALDFDATTTSHSSFASRAIKQVVEESQVASLDPEVRSALDSLDACLGDDRSNQSHARLTGKALSESFEDPNNGLILPKEVFNLLVTADST